MVLSSDQNQHFRSTLRDEITCLKSAKCTRHKGPCKFNSSQIKRIYNEIKNLTQKIAKLNHETNTHACIYVSYMEYWIAFTAVSWGRKSLTATILFSFFLSERLCQENFKNNYMYQFDWLIELITHSTWLQFCFLLSSPIWSLTRQFFVYVFWKMEE